MSKRFSDISSHFKSLLITYREYLICLNVNAYNYRPVDREVIFFCIKLLQSCLLYLPTFVVDFSFECVHVYFQLLIMLGKFSIFKDWFSTRKFYSLNHDKSDFFNFFACIFIFRNESFSMDCWE